MLFRSIKLKVDANFQGTDLTNKAEISSAKDKDGNPATDVDSTPDNTDGNQAGEVNPKDNVVSEDGKNGGDEDDHDFEKVTLGQTFDLALKKELATGQATTVKAGDDVNFTITVLNQGSLDATAIQVTDYIPAGFSLNDANWTAAAGKATLNAPIATLAAGISTTVNIKLKVDAGFQGSKLTNKAEISSAKDGAGNTPTDLDSTPDGIDGNQSGEVNPKDNVVSEDGKNGGDEDDHDLADITIGQTFDLALKKELVPPSAPLKAGDLVTFKISVINQGTLDATAIQVTDYVPTGLTLEDAAWTATAGKAALNTPIATLAAGATTSVNITFKIDANFQGTSLKNSAEISGAKDKDGNPATDVDSTPDATDGNTPGETNPKNDVINEDGNGKLHLVAWLDARALASCQFLGQS